MTGIEAIEQMEDPRRQDRKEWWMKVLFWLVTVLGVVYWIFFFTNYSLLGALSDELYGPITGIISIFLLIVLRLTGSIYARLPRFVALLPALVGGGLSLLLFIGIWVPPFTLGAFFYWDEVIHEQAIQTLVSPDEQRTATVYFRGVGAYGGGNGRTFVRVTHRAVPFIENEVFVEGQSYADDSTREYVRWKDQHTLEIIGEPEKSPITIRVGGF